MNIYRSRCVHLILGVLLVGHVSAGKSPSNNPVATTPMHTVWDTESVVTALTSTVGVRQNAVVDNVLDSTSSLDPALDTEPVPAPETKPGFKRRPLSNSKPDFDSDTDLQKIKTKPVPASDIKSGFKRIHPSKSKPDVVIDEDLQKTKTKPMLKLTLDAPPQPDPNASENIKQFDVKPLKRTDVLGAFLSKHTEKRNATVMRVNNTLLPTFRRKSSMHSIHKPRHVPTMKRVD